MRPLLPGSSGCLVLVTSRRRLTGLDDAHSLALDVLPERDAVALLHRTAGPGRVTEDHPMVPELIALCGRMPLAIRITAARLRHHRALRIEDVVGQLRDESARLDHLRDEDRSLAAAFDLSYAALPPAERHMFRHLGLIPGPDVDAYAAANLIRTDHRSAERILESLLDHNLLTEHAPGRYQFHDLTCVYARTLAANEPAEERAAAVGRLLDYWQHTAQSADRHLARRTRPGSRMDAPVPAAAPELTDRVGSLAWMRTERDNLLAAARTTVHTRPERGIALTAALASFLHQEGPWQHAATLHQDTATAARDLGDRKGEADALQDLGLVRYLTGDYSAVIGLHERALAIYCDLSDRQGEADALCNLGRIRHATGNYAAAAGLHERALAIYRDLGDRQDEANTLHDLGRMRQLTGDHAAAADLLDQSLAICQDLGDRLGEANVLRELGRLRHTTANYPAAAILHERALTICRDLGHRLGEANTLYDLGRLRHATGNYPAAVALHERALAIARDLGHRLGEAATLWDLGRVRHATGNYPVAAALLEQSLAIYRDLGHRLGEANALGDLGRLRQTTGDYPVAAALLEQSQAIFQDLACGQIEPPGSTTTLTTGTVLQSPCGE